MDPATLNNKGTEPEINPEIQKDHEKKGKKALLWLIGKLGVGLGKVGLGSSVFATKAGIVGLLAMGTVTAGGIGYFGAPVLKKLVSSSMVSRKAVSDNPFVAQNAAQQGLQDASQAGGTGVSHLQTYQEGLIPAAEGDLSQGGQQPSGEEAMDSPSAANQAQKLAARGGFGSGERVSGGGSMAGGEAMEPPSPVVGGQPSGTRGNIQSMQRGTTGRVTQGGGRSITSKKGGGSIGALRASAKTSQLATQMSAPESASQTAYQAMTPSAGAGNVEEIGTGLQPQGGVGVTQGGSSPKVSSTVKDIKPAESDAASSDPKPWEKDIARARMLLKSGIALLITAILSALLSKLLFKKFQATVAASALAPAVALQKALIAAHKEAAATAATTGIDPTAAARASAAAIAASTVLAALTPAVAALKISLGKAAPGTVASPEAATIANTGLYGTLQALNKAVSLAAGKASVIAAGAPMSGGAIAGLSSKVLAAEVPRTTAYKVAMTAWKTSRMAALGAAAAGVAVAATGVMINSNYDQGPVGHMWVKSGTALAGLAGTYWWLTSAGQAGMVTGVLTMGSNAVAALIGAGAGYAVGGGLGAIGGKGYRP